MICDWEYSEEFSPNDYFGFIYIIENLINNKKYIGKKVFWYNKKTKKTKKELIEETGRGRRSLYEIVKKESDWKNYYGSNKFLKEDIKQHGYKNFKRTIIKLCKTKKQLTYWETKNQFIFSVLENPEEWYNNNILGKFYSFDLDEGKTTS